MPTVMPFSLPSIKLPPELVELTNSIKVLVEVALPELAAVVDQLRLELKRCNDLTEK